MFLFLVLSHARSTSIAFPGFSVGIKYPDDSWPYPSGARTLVFGPVQSVEGHSNLWYSYPILAGPILCMHLSWKDLLRKKGSGFNCFLSQFFRFLVEQSPN